MINFLPAWRQDRPHCSSIGILVAISASLYLLADTGRLRFARDVNRMVYNDNLGLLENSARAAWHCKTDSMR